MSVPSSCIAWAGQSRAGDRLVRARPLSGVSVAVYSKISEERTLEHRHLRVHDSTTGSHPLDTSLPQRASVSCRIFMIACPLKHVGNRGLSAVRMVRELIVMVC